MCLDSFARMHAYAPVPLQPVQQHDWPGAAGDGVTGLRRQQQGPQGNANSMSPASITQA